MREMTHVAAMETWGIGAAAIAAIMCRPWRIGEWVWPVVASAALVACGLISGSDAAAAALDGLDVYLFLAGMLTLAEIARVHGVFDWLAAKMADRAAGNALRLFVWVYGSGIAVTALLSNDGTIVLLTPAVLALTKRVRLPGEPYLYACAFISNAASFVLPISNPANLVVFRQLPKLLPWLWAFAVPSAVAIAVTFAVLRYVFRRDLQLGYQTAAAPIRLDGQGLRAFVVVSASAAAIVAAAGFGLPIGRVTIICAAISLLSMSLVKTSTFGTVVREAPWSIIPLVAGLFVIVQALDRTGVLADARLFFRHAGSMPHAPARVLVGGAVALADNVLNNLPVGILTRYALRDNAIAPHVANAALVGVDLGPNLSLTGSLATLLWLMMLRREGIEVSPWRFIGVGAFVTVPALVVALVCVR